MIPIQLFNYFFTLVHLLFNSPRASDIGRVVLLTFNTAMRASERP